MEPNKITLTATLNTNGPILNASFESAGGVDHVKDVRVNNQSVVEHKIANINTGEGLEFVDGNLQVTDELKLAFIELNVAAGNLTPEELSLLAANKTNRLIYNNKVYYLAIADSNTRQYFTTDTVEPNVVYVDMQTGAFHTETVSSPTLQNHIEDTTIHITAAERASWNNKVSTALSPDTDPAAPINSFILQFPR